MLLITPASSPQIPPWPTRRRGERGRAVCPSSNRRSRSVTSFVRYFPRKGWKAHPAQESQNRVSPKARAHAWSQGSRSETLVPLPLCPHTLLTSALGHLPAHRQGKSQRPRQQCSGFPAHRSSRGSPTTWTRRWSTSSRAAPGNTKSEPAGPGEIPR